MGGGGRKRAGHKVDGSNPRIGSERGSSVIGPEWGRQGKNSLSGRHPQQPTIGLGTFPPPPPLLCGLLAKIGGPSKSSPANHRTKRGRERCCGCCGDSSRRTIFALLLPNLAWLSLTFDSRLQTSRAILRLRCALPFPHAHRRGGGGTTTTPEPKSHFVKRGGRPWRKHGTARLQVRVDVLARFLA